MPSCSKNLTEMLKCKVNNWRWNKQLFYNPDKDDKANVPNLIAEQILLKNIFDDCELEKNKPDYIPSQIVHRMEVRRSLMRDSHTHGNMRYNIVHFKSKLQRNKNMKEISRVNRELHKIKHDFNKSNIKNKIHIKHVSSKANIHVPKLFPVETETLEGREPMNETKNCVNFEMKANLNEEIIIQGEDYDTSSSNNDNEIVTEKPNKSKTVMNSDHVEDLQTAISLMELYSDKTSLLSNKERSQSNTLEEKLKIDEYVVEQETERKHCISNDLIKIVSLSNIARKKFLAKKYFSQWKQFTNNRKVMSELRKKTMNDFFERLIKEKCELKKNTKNENNVKPKDKAQLIAIDQSTYKHRYQVQKNIIALQKLKLDEQNRIIEELKYKKIIEANKESTETMKESLKNSYSDMDRRLKPKIKCLTNELKLREIEDPTLVLHCLKVPQFLQRMEKRAREREEKHAIIRERRRQMEEERLRIKQQAEIAKAEMDKEEKERRIKELKEKRKQEKIEAIRRKQHAERIRALTVMADLHYEKHLIQRYGVAPWMRLMDMKRDNEHKAELHYEMLLKRNCFLHWMWHTEDVVMERNYIAEEWHRKKLLRAGFVALKRNHQILVLKQQVADDYYDFFVQKLVFRKFWYNITLMKKEQQTKWDTAVKYHESNLMFRTLTHWRVLPALCKLQREREARKSRWRQKVLLVVPDYKPPQD